MATRTQRTVSIFATTVLVGGLLSGLLGAGPAAAAGPPLSVTTVASGLSVPWNMVVAPDGTILTGERAGRFVAVTPGGDAKQVSADLSRVFATKEAGLMGLAIDPAFSTTRRVYSCQAEKTGGGNGSSVPPDLANLPVPLPNTGQVINVVSWLVSADWNRMVRERTVLSGIPVNSGGRHAGCGITAASDGTLWIGTGDNAVRSMPQDRKALGGKVLHINANGTPARGNPFAGSPIYTLGHRNVQNVAIAPSGRVYAIEQGTSVDDELNLLRSGGNYGYRPDRAPFIYDESVPMTDPARVPGAIGAVWRSGSPTLATPGLRFLPTSGWGDWGGAAVISAQKGKRLVFVKLSADGSRVVRTSEALQDQYGRLRGLAIDRDGSLLISTDNGSDDKILRVRFAG
ncbi:PQQ-dependent sugar dehydrogenase [Gordonia sp. CPCC 205333]|uniref:PQQ-dependent sugar dehydrogenase n=1 Tax=Gordonia sp. CPCC 205333 TaxID=3140790 RepID=UPI003AF33D06